mgnify:CR=1 FL=1|tara:strand:- start:6214 stop:6657 length:444 start_codon:yes stop_codon:yes gene_type:complete
MKRIIYTNENGGTSIVVPAPHITDYEALAKNTVPAGLSYEIVDVSTIPSDRTLRNIWKHDTTASLAKIGVNMLEAKDVLLSEVRTKRNVALEELDKQYAIATRTGADTAPLDAQRTELLNATDALKALDVNGDGIVTPEEALVTLGV